MKKTGKINLGLFALITFSFLLPFVKISCNEDVVTKLSGTQLAFGTTIEKHETLDGKTREIKSEKTALYSFCIAVIGIILSYIFAKTKMQAVKSAIIVCSISGVICLYLLSVELDKQVLQRNVLTIEYEIGYYIAFVGFISAFVLNLIPERGGNEVKKDT